jgi:hypothetical protein
MDKLDLAITTLKAENNRLKRELARVRTAITLLQQLPGGNGRSHRKISAAGLARIRAAQRKRWAKWRKKHK